MNNPINHPSHYNVGKIEVISAIDDWKLGFNLGNVVKYIARADYKENALVDLEKAAWYLNREIERRKGTWEDPANKINQDEFEKMKNLYSNPTNLLDALVACPNCGMPPRILNDLGIWKVGCGNTMCAATFYSRDKFQNQAERMWNAYARAKRSSPLEQFPVAKDWSDYHPLKNLPPKYPVHEVAKHP